MTTMIMRRFALFALSGALLVALTRAQDGKKVLAKKHNWDREALHHEIEGELERKNNVESFTCTLEGASGQDQCDASADDDGSKCVWCVLNSFGFCVSASQAATMEQVLPTIDCDDKPAPDDDKPAPDDDKPVPPPDDDKLWGCLESKDEASCSTTTCVWCNTKGGFGVCLTPEAAALAKDSYWFDCPKEEVNVDTILQGAREEEEPAGEDDEDDDSEDEEDYELDDEEETDDGLHEFVVDTSCLLSAMLLDPADDEASSETACFAAKDGAGNRCEWCAVAGSPFRLCLSEPQAQVAEYVGAACTGSDESFEPEEFDDSCIAHMHADPNLSKAGCWRHQDLDGNSCEWCNLLGVELCLGGVQAELVEHWGATCVMDRVEDAMAQAAIKQHVQHIEAQREARRIQKEALKASNPEKTDPEEEDEDDIDLKALWLSSDSSCMVTTLRTSFGDDAELSCARALDKEGNPCNWCQMGTAFDMCLNNEQADIAEYLGMECETVTVQAQEILRAHDQRVSEYKDDTDDDKNEADDDEDQEEGVEDDDDDEEEEDGLDDVRDFDPSCLMAMEKGLDQTTCVNAKDEDGLACEWCSWNQFQLCLASEQAQMVEPFGVKCDAVTPRTPTVSIVPEAAILKELTAKIDTSCLIDAGQFNDPEKCTSATDSLTGKPCEWCSLGSLGVKACLSAEQAKIAHPMGAVCQEDSPSVDADAILRKVPKDFWSCLVLSRSVDDCDATCTWCDLKGSPTESGLCLSDDVADAISAVGTDGLLDCDAPDIEDDDEESKDEHEEDAEESKEDAEEDGDEEDDDDDDDEDDDDAEESEEDTLKEEIA